MSYDQISEKLGHMDSKLDTLLTLNSDHELRLRGLEKRERWLAGFGAALAAMWAFIIGK
jgi:hypothetical protein